MKKQPTLLEKAKSTNTGRRKRTPVTVEEIELAVAWVHSEVGNAQVAVALGLNKHTNVQSWIPSRLRTGVELGLVTVTFNKKGDTT